MTDELILRVLMGRASEEERAAVAAWRSASDANAQAYAEVERVLADAAAWYESADTPPPPTALELVRRAELRDAGAIDDKPARVRGRGAWSDRRWSVLRAAALIILTFGLGAAVASWHEGRTAALAAASIVAGPSGVTPITLSDGTAIQLAAGSRLRVLRRHDRREVTLEGRAEFTVARMLKLPFVVHTAAGDARDLGTRFVVRTDANSTDVAVFEGRVALTENGTSIELAAGDVGRAVTGESPWRTSQDDARSDADWLRASLVFNGEPLAQVARSLDELYHYHIDITDSAIAHRTVSAWFVDPPAPRDAVIAICRAVGAKCVVGDSSATISARSP